MSRQQPRKGLLLGWVGLGLLAAACSSYLRHSAFAAPRSQSSFGPEGAASTAAVGGTRTSAVPWRQLGSSDDSSATSRTGSVARSAVPGGLYPEALPPLPPFGLELAWEGFAGLIALYVIMSFNEYVYHRYFQHLGINKVGVARAIRDMANLPTYKGDGHVEHHRETLDDMTLDQRPNPDLDADPFRGTAFPWWAFCAMTVSVLGPSLPILGALGWSTNLILVVVFVATLTHTMVWNALHPNMHGLPDVPLSEGPPSFLFKGFRDSEVFKWLRKNHEGHHRVGGAHGNYNVCLPLMDQLVGTYVGEIAMQEVAQEGA